MISQKQKDIQIRKIQKEDIEKIIPLLEQVSTLHINMRSDIFKEKTEANMQKEILDIINNEEKISLVAEEKEKILGIIVLKIKKVIDHINLKNSKVLWIEELCVDENNRGKGIGKILINNAKKIAKDLKCERLELNCWEANKDAITFYEKQGMKSQRRVMEIKI